MNEETLQIEILDEIGGWGFTFQDLLAKAKGFKGKKIRVPVNSYGGSVLDALAIYNYLKGHKAEVETHIPAFAMSAGTIIASAGDRVTMAENGFYMIHNPWSLAMGDSGELEHVADILDKMKAEMVDIYYAKTKRKVGKKDISRMMDDETWMTAKEAFDLGFVDELTQGAKIEASFNPKAFKNFVNVPDAVWQLTGAKPENDMNILEAIKAFFFGAEPATDTQVQELLTQHGTLGNYRDAIRTEIEAELKAAHTAEIAALESSLAGVQATLNEMSEARATAEQQAGELKAQVEDLTAQIVILKATPATDHTKGATEPEEVKEAKVYSLFTLRAAEKISKSKGLPKW